MDEFEKNYMEDIIQGKETDYFDDKELKMSITPPSIVRLEEDYPIFKNLQFIEEDADLDKFIENKKLINELNKKASKKNSMIPYNDKEYVEDFNGLERSEAPALASKIKSRKEIFKPKTDKNLPDESSVINEWLLVFGLSPEEKPQFFPKKYKNFELIWKGNYTCIFKASKYSKENYKPGGYAVIRTWAVSNEPGVKWFSNYDKARNEAILSILEIKDYARDILEITLIANFPPLKYC